MANLSILFQFITVNRKFIMLVRKLLMDKIRAQNSVCRSPNWDPLRFGRFDHIIISCLTSANAVLEWDMIYESLIYKRRYLRNCEKRFWNNFLFALNGQFSAIRPIFWPTDEICSSSKEFKFDKVPRTWARALFSVITAHAPMLNVWQSNRFELFAMSAL